MPVPGMPTVPFNPFWERLSVAPVFPKEIDKPVFDMFNLKNRDKDSVRRKRSGILFLLGCE